MVNDRSHLPGNNQQPNAMYPAGMPMQSAAPAPPFYPSSMFAMPTMAHVTPAATAHPHALAQAHPAGGARGPTAGCMPRMGAGMRANEGADMSTLASVCTADLPERRASTVASNAAPSTPADFVYGGNCPGLQLLTHFDGKAEAETPEALLAQINPVKTMVINKLGKVDCPNPKRWNESQKVLYPCREHSSISLNVRIGPPGRRVLTKVEIVCCFSTNCKRSYWKLKSSARNWMCYFDNTELSEQCRVKCMCMPQRCSSCDEAKCAGTDTLTAKPLLKQLEWLWERHKAPQAMTDISHAERMQAIAITERLLERLRDTAPPGTLPPPSLGGLTMPSLLMGTAAGAGGGVGAAVSLMTNEQHAVMGMLPPASGAEHGAQDGADAQASKRMRAA